LCLLVFLFHLPALSAPSTSLRLATRWSGVVAPLELSRAQRAWLARHPHVRVGVLKDAGGPLDIVDAAGNYRGVSAEYLAIVAKALNVDIELSVFSDRSALVSALKAGSVDMAGAVQRSDDEKGLVYSSTYFSDRAVIATRVDDPGFSIAPWSNDHVLAFVDGTVSEAALKRAYPAMRLLALPTLSATLYAVAFGQAQAGLGSAAAVNYVIDQHQLLNVSVTDVAPLVAGAFRFAAATHNAALIAMVSAVLANVADSEKEAIRALWVGSDARYTLGGDPQLDARERAWIAGNKQVRYAVRQEYSPFVMGKGDGTAAGFGVDLLRLIGQKTGLEFVPVPVDPSDPRAARASADLIIAASPSDPALSQWVLSEPYSDTPEVIVARKTRRYHDLLSLSGKTVVIGPERWASRGALERTGARFVEASTVWDAADRLLFGTADAWVTNITTANYITQFQDELAVVGATGEPEHRVAFAVNPDRLILVGILNKALASMSVSRMRSVRDKWLFSRQVRTPWDKRRPQVLAFVFIALLLIGMFFVWNHLLRREIRRRRQVESDLAAAIEIAEEANNAKSRFLATMSHEIRTPMNAVLGVLELIRESDCAGDSRAAAVDAAYDSAQALLALIEDILDLSKIESGKLELVPVPTDCGALFRSVANVFEGLARQRQLRFLVDIRNTHQVGALVDPIRLRQILSNLLSNAVKFTEQGEISLRAEIEPLVEDHVAVTLRVSDTGIGISADEQAKLFQPFVQADRTIGTRFGGSGLGLAICRRLVDLMGGTLSLTSRVGAGTSVEVGLRACSAKLEAAPPMESVALLRGRFEGRVALIVDDHAANLLVLARQLEFLGFRVTCTADGTDALKRILSTPFDLVITDLFMAGMTGYELARAVRANASPPGGRIALVGCTANAQPETVERALAAGMDQCLTKPLSIAALFKCVAALLESPQASGGTAPSQGKPATAIVTAEVAPTAWIDRAVVKQIVADDAQLEMRLFETVVATNRETLATLRSATERNDREAFRAACHHLCGGLRFIGAHAVVRECERAERQAMEGSAPLRLLLEQMEPLLGAVEDALVDRLSEFGPPS
jgi:two-component system sensor histidine kinase EvgS